MARVPSSGSASRPRAFPSFWCFCHALDQRLPETIPSDSFDAASRPRAKGISQLHRTAVSASHLTASRFGRCIARPLACCSISTTVACGESQDTDRLPRHGQQVLSKLPPSFADSGCPASADLEAFTCVGRLSQALVSASLPNKATLCLVRS